MFSWLKEMLTKLNSTPNPEARWVVRLDGDSICVTDDEGKTDSLSKDNLRAVVIATNDSGPWGADVWWVLIAHNEADSIEFPQGAAGHEAIIDYLIALPDFDGKAMVNAMACTDNESFLVWRSKP